MKTPIELKLDGITVGEILSFSYETPWATGKVKFKDKSLFEKLVAVSSTSSFDLEMDELGLDDAEEEKMWEAKLKELCISWEDLKLDRDDRWSVIPNGGESQPIYSPRFSEQGFIDYRL
ncbi:MAG: hypothetical protein COB09_15695 [Thalassobium sp.]|nr:MAG: hypothetical protein COB09_15695 [Thalassobium sp.]